MAAPPYLSSSAIIRHDMERVTGDPHQAWHEIVSAFLQDVAATGLTLTKRLTPRVAACRAGARFSGRAKILSHK